MKTATNIYLTIIIYTISVFISPAKCDEKSKPNTLQKFTVTTNTPNNRKLEFLYRIPKIDAKKHAHSVLVMFGGRNWKAERTFRIYKFESLADKYNIYLLSPSFCNDEYWQPEKWSGNALFAALEKLKKQHNLANPQIFYYGYSAGGQCANLFYFWKPAPIKAVAFHACGVYEKNISKTKTVPFLITCGEKDDIRFQLSYTFTQKLRELNSSVIFKNYSTEHGLNPASLNLAKSFIGDIISGKTKTTFFSEDFIDEIYDADSKQKIDKEFKNNFYSKQTAELWLNN
jgi:poly(3-hydroxybutyrate) depolymerase